MASDKGHGVLDKIVGAFLNSNLSLLLMVLAAALGLAALFLTPREEDPQIVVPMADVYVKFPGHGAKEVEQLVSAPLEKILYQIDGVEHVYSMSGEGEAVITVRYFVGEDRERSLVKLYKKIDENIDTAPPGVTGWVVKPVEIDDVPIVTFALSSEHSDGMALRSVAEELAQHFSGLKDVSRAYVAGGSPRVVQIYMDAERMAAYHVSPLELKKSLEAANVRIQAGEFRKLDNAVQVEAGEPFSDARQLFDLVLGVSDGHPIFLKDVAKVVDGPAELDNYVRYGWGPAQAFANHEGFPGSSIGGAASRESGISSPAVTVAVAKKKGANAVDVAKETIKLAQQLKKSIVPQDMDLIVTRNYGLTANEKVNELVWGLAVAVLIIIALLCFGLGWREALIVALAVPVVFGLTLALNLGLGFTINRVTLFALILSLGLLVDDPIVDVENIARHFTLWGKASRRIVLDAVSEIRPPLIVATLAVIASFLPMFFITGMMGPYMKPMAFNVPVAMLMSMLVAFTITPWLSYHFLKGKYATATPLPHSSGHEIGDLKGSAIYKIIAPALGFLLKSKARAWCFLGLILLLTLGAASLAAFRAVPLKMLPFDNKNELLLVLDFDEGTTLERSDAAVHDFEGYLSSVPEVVGWTSYAGLSSPMDFNGMVRHYYLRKGGNVAEVRINLAGKDNRKMQSHSIGLRMRDGLQQIAMKHSVRMKLVETPPGPPVLASVVAEVYGGANSSYEDILNAADIVKERFAAEPGATDLDTIRQAPQKRLTFIPDKEKAAINGISSENIAKTLKLALSGEIAGLIQSETERNPLKIELRLPEDRRSSMAELSRIRIKGDPGQLVPLSELGRWESSSVDQQIYHKDLKRVAYVYAETAGRPPADVVVDVQSDKTSIDGVKSVAPRPVAKRSFLSNGSGINWGVKPEFKVDFAGEGEWKITLDVFRDLGLAFGAAMVVIYILLVVQTSSFVMPLVIMMAIPLTVIGVMPGFWALNALSAKVVGGYLDPVYFTATAMIGMIALSGIVTRNSIILIDFTHLSLSQGRDLVEALIESCVVRLRPILLTAGAAMLGSIPIIIDPIFSGLAWSLIFGLFASTFFTLFVIPVAYWLIYAGRPGHGLKGHGDDL